MTVCMTMNKYTNLPSQYLSSPLSIFCSKAISCECNISNLMPFLPNIYFIAVECLNILSIFFHLCEV